MDQSSSPFVLFVDDDAAFARGQAAQLERVGIRAIGGDPSDLAISHVEQATLVVVDQVMDHWDPPAGSASLSPQDGVAIAANLRSINPDIGTIILTGEINELAGDIPDLIGEHQVASLRDVDWVFRKDDSRLQSRLMAFIRLLDSEYSLDSVLDLPEWLGLPDAVWREHALDLLERCRPPIGPSPSEGFRRNVRRWLLQRILPYPTWLLSDSQAALMLALEKDVFADVASLPELENCEYRGPAYGFLGRRWWRAGLVAGRDSREIERFQGRYAEAAYVIPLGDELEDLDPELRENCAPAFPDGWPAYADQAWVARRDIAPGTMQQRILGLAGD